MGSVRRGPALGDSGHCHACPRGSSIHRGDGTAESGQHRQVMEPYARLDLGGQHVRGVGSPAVWRQEGQVSMVLPEVGLQGRCGVVWCGVVWCGVVWCGVVWCGVVWCGVVWCGVVWCGVVWCGVVWCGVVWCGVVWCGVVWCGVVWCGVVWCGVVLCCCVVLCSIVLCLCCIVLCCVLPGLFGLPPPFATWGGTLCMQPSSP